MKLPELDPVVSRSLIKLSSCTACAVKYPIPKAMVKIATERIRTLVMKSLTLRLVILWAIMTLSNKHTASSDRIQISTLCGGYPIFKSQSDRKIDNVQGSDYNL